MSYFVVGSQRVKYIIRVQSPTLIAYSFVSYVFVVWVPRRESTSFLVLTNVKKLYCRFLASLL